MVPRKRSSVTGIEFRDRLKAIGMSHARFAHAVGYSLDAVRLHLSHSAKECIPIWLERALIYEEAFHAIDILIAGKGKRASKRTLKAIRAKTKMDTKPPERRRAKRKPRKVNLLAPRFLRQPPPAPPPPSPQAKLEAGLDVLAQRIGQKEADALRARFGARRPPTIGRPVRDADDPPRSRTTDPI
jgi:hypothetical protein